LRCLGDHRYIHPKPRKTAFAVVGTGPAHAIGTP
jgi:hypothetical protein